MSQVSLQGYLAHQKHFPPGTLQKDYTWGPVVVLGGVAVSYERGTPVNPEIRDPGSKARYPKPGTWTRKLEPEIVW